jgi:mRNA-degrading endonuclease RelE of RelBE toxin-antitoxin system
VIGEIHKAISQITTEPEIGEKKKSELEFFLVHKFRALDIQYLLAYTIDTERQQIVLTAVGPHENFYRDLKR